MYSHVSKSSKVHSVEVQPLSSSDVIIPNLDDHTAVAFDLDIDEDEVFRRYESVFRAFLKFGVFRTLETSLTEADIGKNIQNTIVDFSVAFAMQGSTYIEEIQMNMQYTVLQSALVLTISMPLYIDPPSFDDRDTNRVFSAIIGLAAFNQLIVIIGCTIVSALLNCPYNPSGAMVARVKANGLLVFVNIVNYLANFSTLAAMLVAGFSRTFIDGVVQLYTILLVVAMVTVFITFAKLGVRLQDTTVFGFYVKYCDANGRLKREYLERVYADRSGEKKPAGKSTDALDN